LDKHDEERDCEAAWENSSRNIGALMSKPDNTWIDDWEIGEEHATERNVSMELVQCFSEWIDHNSYMLQLQAAWLRLTNAEPPLNPRIAGEPGLGKTTLVRAVGRSTNRQVYIFQCTYGHEARGFGDHAGSCRGTANHLPGLGCGHRGHRMNQQAQAL
jgi:hypothetical protein